MEPVFWIAAGLLAHTYLVYPLSLFAWDAFRQTVSAARYLAGRDRRAPDRTFPPWVTLVVPAFNEAACIRQKLENCLSLDYPEARLEVMVGSDGSTDETDAAVAACADPRVRLSRGERAGKAAVLNRCIGEARGEVVVLTDANTLLDRKAVQRLARRFGDPRVGAVCGRLQLFDRTREQLAESAYWAYENLVKYYEGKHGAVLGANGGLYAIRRDLWKPLPERTIVDDLLVPLRILQDGYQVLYDPEARAIEEMAGGVPREFARRARIGAGNFQALVWMARLLSPRRGFVAYALFSHKVIRWCAPQLMVAALGANLALLEAPLYRLTLLLQLAFYALAALGLRPAGRGPLARSARAAHYFVAMNLALLAGFWRFLRGAQSPAWERTAR